MDEIRSALRSWLGTGSLNIFGRPFAGKDTQGELLAKYFDGSLLSSGDILRHATDNQRLQDLMAKGEIVPSDLFEEVAVPYLQQTQFAGKPLILSEVGRVLGEEQVVLRATAESGHEQKAVIHLRLTDEEVWKRFDVAMQTGDRGVRADDNRTVLQTRLDAYTEKVLPVLEYYRDSGMLIEVDGTLSKDEVFQAILDGLTVKSRQA